MMKRPNALPTASRRFEKRSSPVRGQDRGNLVDLQDWSNRKRNGGTGILVVGTDFSTRSDRALRRATSIGARGAFELLLVHVDNDEPLESIDTSHGRKPELLREIERSIAENDGIACRSEIRSGSVAEQLVGAAQESRAELLIIGPHRRAFFRDRFRRTTAERIIRQASIPLIVANSAPVPYRRVLFPTDLNTNSRRALKAVRALPFVEESEWVLLHIYDAEARQMLHRTMAIPDEQESYLEAVASHAQNELAKFANNARCPNVRCVASESSGSIASDIVDFASEDEADLIVLSRSGKGIVAQTVVGSVTDAVLRKSRRDLLIVPGALHSNQQAAGPGSPRAESPT